MEQQHYQHRPLPSAALHQHEHIGVSQQMFQHQQPGMPQREQLPGHGTSTVHQQGPLQYQGYATQQRQYQAQEMPPGPVGNMQQLNPEKAPMRSISPSIGGPGAQTSSLPRHLQPRPPPQQRKPSPGRQQTEQEQYASQHNYKPAAAYTSGLQADAPGSLNARPPPSAAGQSFPQAPCDMPMHNMPQVPPPAFQSAVSYEHAGSSGPTAPGPAYAPSAGAPRQAGPPGSQQPQAWYQMPPPQVNPQQQTQPTSSLEQPQSLNQQPLPQESQQHYQQQPHPVQPQHYQFGEGCGQHQSSHRQHGQVEEGGNLQNVVQGAAPMVQPLPGTVQQPPFAATGFNLPQGMMYMSTEGLIFPPQPVPLQAPSMDPQAGLSNYMRQLPHVPQQPVSIQVDSKGQVMLVSMASSGQLGVLPTAEVQLGSGPGPSVPAPSGLQSPVYAGPGPMPPGQSGLGSAPSGHAGPTPPMYGEAGLPPQPVRRGPMSESSPQPAPEPSTWPQNRQHTHQEPPYGGSAPAERASSQRPVRAPDEESKPSRPYESERPYGRQQDAHTGTRRDESGSRRDDAYARRDEAAHRVGDQGKQHAEGHRHHRHAEDRRDSEGRRHPDERRHAEDRRHAERSAQTRPLDGRVDSDVAGRRTDSRRPAPAHSDTDVGPSRTAPGRTRSAERGAKQPVERSERAQDHRAGGRSDPSQRETAPPAGTAGTAPAKKAAEREAKLSLQAAIKRCETLEGTLQLTRSDPQLRASTLPGLLTVCEHRLADLSLAIKQAQAEAAAAEAAAVEAEAAAAAAEAALAELDSICEGEDEDDLGPETPLGHLAFLLERSVRSVWPLETPEHQLLRTCAEALLLEVDGERVVSVNNEELQLQPYELVGAKLCNIPAVLEKSALVRTKTSSMSTMQVLRCSGMFDVREHKNRQEPKSRQWLVRLRVEQLPSYGEVKSILRASVDALLPPPPPHRPEGRQQAGQSRGASTPASSRARSDGGGGNGSGSLFSITSKDPESLEQRQVLRCVALFAVGSKDRKQGLFGVMPEQAVGALPPYLAEKYGGQRLENLTNLILGYPIFRNSPGSNPEMSDRIMLYTNPLLELQYRLREMQQEPHGSKKRRLAGGSAGGGGDGQEMKELEQWWQNLRSPRSS